MKILFASLLFFTSIYTMNEASSIYDFTVQDIDDQKVALSEYKGKVVVIVNTASKCGLTPQYEDLQQVYEKYKDKGLVILGFPANNFMGQEPGSNEEIKTFCTSRFNVSFPMFSKISVKGRNIHPLYAYLTSKDKNGVLDAPVAWNFQKFIINKSGKVHDSVAPSTKLSSGEVIKKIEKLLNS